MSVMAHTQGWCVDTARTRGRLSVRLRSLGVAVLVLAVALLALAILAVRLHVLGEVVGPHESLVANGAGEPLLAGVCSKMTLKFVGSCETFSTEQPVTYERPLASVPPQMCFQMRSLSVDLATPRNVTTVNVSFSKVSSGGSETFGFLAVRAVTGGPAGVSPR